MKNLSQICLASLIVLLAQEVWATEFFVAPTTLAVGAGSPTGDGSINKPWDLKTALMDNTKSTNKNFVVKPGDTIWLRGGTYTGVFDSKLMGSATKPIIVRNYKQERVIIDGNDPTLTISTSTISHTVGGYVWYQGIEITNTNTQRNYPINYDSAPEGRAGGISILVPGVKLLHLVVHDASDGITAWVPATDFEAYGNVVYNVGWNDPNGYKGHGFYMQNTTTNKLVENNISFNNFKFTAQLFGKQADLLNNFTFKKNIFFNPNTIMLGGSSSTALNNIVFDENYLFNDTVQIGYMNAYNTNIKITNNYISIKGDTNPQFTLAKNVTVTGNNIFSNDGTQLVLLALTALPDNTPADYFFDNNNYTIIPGYGFYVHNGGTQGICRSMWFNSSFAPSGAKCSPEVAPKIFWQTDLGFDANSTYSNKFPTTAKIFINKKDAYDPDRSNIAIYNWAKTSTVDIPASQLQGVLSDGDTYELHSVLDYFNDVKTGTYKAGSNLSVDMNPANHAVAKPIGFDQLLGPNTFPEFGAFVLIRTGTSTNGVLKGDVSGDGKVTIYDASLAAQYAVGIINLNANQIAAADVSGDAMVSLFDASLIARFAIGLISSWTGV